MLLANKKLRNQCCCMAAAFLVALPGARAEITSVEDHIKEWELSSVGGPVSRGGDGDFSWEKIDKRTGTLQLHETDLVIPGPGGFTLSVGRTFSGGSDLAKRGVVNDLGNWELDLPKIVGNRTKNSKFTDSFCKNPSPGSITQGVKAEKHSYAVQITGTIDVIEEIGECEIHQRWKPKDGIDNCNYIETNYEDLDSTNASICRAKINNALKSTQTVLDEWYDPRWYTYCGHADRRSITYKLYDKVTKSINLSETVSVPESNMVDDVRSRTWAGIILVAGGAREKLVFRDGLVSSLSQLGGQAEMGYESATNWTASCRNVGGRSSAGFEVKSPDGKTYVFGRESYPVQNSPEFPYIYKTSAPHVDTAHLTEYRDSWTGDYWPRYEYGDNGKTRLLSISRYQAQTTRPLISYWVSNKSAATVSHFFEPVEWLVTELKDRNGNTTTFEYEAAPDSMGRLHVKKVTGTDGATAGNRVVEFFYKEDVAGVGKLLDYITGAEKKVNYYYNAQNHLIEVKRANGSFKYCYYGDSGCSAANSVAGQKQYEVEKVTTPYGGTVSYLYNTIQAPDYGFGPGEMAVLKQRNVADNTVSTAVNGEWKYELVQPFDSNDYPGATAGVTERQTAMRIKTPDVPAASASTDWDYYTFAATSDWKRGLLRYTKNRTYPTYYDWRNVRKAGNGFGYAAPAGEHVIAPLTVKIDDGNRKQLTTYQYPLGENYGLPEKIKTEGFVGNEVSSRTVGFTYDNKLTNGKYILGLVKEEIYAGLVGNNKIVRNFDDKGNLSTETRFAEFDSNGVAKANTGSVSKYGYWPTGDLEWRKNPRGYTEYFNNYKRGLAQTVTNFEGNSMTRIVNDDGTVASEKDFRGNSTTFKYDAAGRVKYVTYPEGNAKIIQWTGNTEKEGWDSAGTQLLGSAWTETVLDGFGRPVSISEKAIVSGAEKLDRVVDKRRYDAFGRTNYVAHSYSPSAGEVEKGMLYEYGRYGDLSGTSESDVFTTYYRGLGYDTVLSPRRGEPSCYGAIDIWDCFILSSGQQEITYVTHDLSFPYESRMAKEIQKSTLYAADPVVKQAIVRDPLGRVTSLTLTDIAKNTSQTRTFKYNASQFLWKITNPETGVTDVTDVTELGTDAAGNVVSRQVGSSPATTMAYFPSDRIKAVDFVDPLTPDITYEYDANGNQTLVKNLNAIWSYRFDLNNHMDQETVEMGALKFSFGHAYNTKQAHQTMTYPSGRTLDHLPNEWGIPGALTPYVSSVQRWGNGAWREVNYQNGRKTTGTLNARNWPESITTDSSVLTLNYKYDSHGNITSIGRTPDSSYDINAIEDSNYDNLGRLHRLYSKWGGSTNVTNTIDYDGFGNISAQNVNGRALSYTYDTTNNRLDSVTGISGRYSKLTYDLYGNVKGDGSFGYVYDEAGNLTSVSPPAPNKSTVYSYDGHGRMVKRQNSTDTAYVVYGLSGQRLLEYRPGDDAGLADDKVSEFYYLDNRLVASRDLTALDKADTDGDTMSDAYELKYGLNPGAKFYGGNTGFDDRDGDGVSDLVEFQKGWNPANADMDGDGLLDGQEYVLGLNPLKADTDGDGVSDKVEVDQHRNPLVNEAAIMTIINTLLLN